MAIFWKLLSFALLWLISTSLSAQPTQVEALRYWVAPERTRMVFDISNEVQHHLFMLDNPSRLVIDLKNARLPSTLAQPEQDNALFKGVRAGIRNKKDLRIVVDLKQKITPKSFTLKPRKSYGHRLVVDLYGTPVISATNNDKKSQTIVADTSKAQSREAIKTLNHRGRDIIVAIDAGHGGEDPGAKGKRGTQEKKVVLDIAKQVAALIDKQPGMKAVLVRKGDYYIKLRRRMEIAREAKADLFVSIHADAFKNSSVKGASVFTLSNRGASSEAARWLASHENAADLVGGVSLSDKEDMLASVLIDLSQTATKEASLKVASEVLKNFGHIGSLHSHKVQKAGFMVLKSPDIPSILVETAFISNPQEERNLTSQAHQAKMAKAIYSGIVNYFENYAPADTYFAQKANLRHVISRGETLSGIAQQYGVSMKSIKVANEMANNEIKVGQVLTIPKG